MLGVHYKFIINKLIPLLRILIPIGKYNKSKYNKVCCNVNQYGFARVTHLFFNKQYSLCSIDLFKFVQYKFHRDIQKMDTFGQGNYTAFNYNEEGQYMAKTCDLHGTARASFIKKVYMILLMQIATTVIFSALSIYNLAFFAFQVNNLWLLYLSIVVAIGIQLYMFCCQGGRTFPSNVICVGLFTFAESYMVSFVCSITGKQSGNGIVLLAAVYTLVIVVACTIYAATTESDFTTSYGIIIVLSAAMLVLFIVTLFTSSPFIHNLYCCIGVVLFGIYLVIDTQMIMGGRTIELAIDQYYLAAMLLYIDIIQIFLYILELLKKD